MFVLSILPITDAIVKSYGALYSVGLHLRGSEDVALEKVEGRRNTISVCSPLFILFLGALLTLNQRYRFLDI
jgi:hypothetical protein